MRTRSIWLTVTWLLAGVAAYLISSRLQRVISSPIVYLAGADADADSAGYGHPYADADQEAIDAELSARDIDRQMHLIEIGQLQRGECRRSQFARMTQIYAALYDYRKTVIDEAIADGHKSLVFSQWPSLLGHVRLDVDLPASRRRPPRRQ